MAQEKRKIGLGTYALASFWIAFLLGMPWAVAHHRQRFEEMFYRADGRTAGTAPFKHSVMFGELGKTRMALPFSTRILVRIPMALWIFLGLLFPVALVWKSKALSRNAGDLVDVLAVAALFGAGLFCAVGLLLPYIVLQE